MMKTTKKETAKKPAETKSKVSSLTDKIKNIKSTKTVTPANPTIDMSDPKNAELYADALLNSLRLPHQ